MEDYREAYAWYYASAKCGSKDAQIELSILAPKISDKNIEQGTAIGNIYYDRYCR
jgi:TPR repeat protein